MLIRSLCATGPHAQENPHTRLCEYVQLKASGATESQQLSKKDLRSRFVVSFRDMRILDCDPLLPLSCVPAESSPNSLCRTKRHVWRACCDVHSLHLNLVREVSLARFSPQALQRLNLPKRCHPLQPRRLPRAAEQRGGARADSFGGLGARKGAPAAAPLPPRPTAPRPALADGVETARGARWRSTSRTSSRAASRPSLSSRPRAGASPPRRRADPWGQGESGSRTRPRGAPVDFARRAPP